MRAALRLCALPAVLAVTAAPAEELAVCFNYGCSERVTVWLSPVELGQVQEQFVGADTAAAEREAMARAVAWLYFHAAMQTPIWRDRGENFDDDDQHGRMDCIDHSTNTTTFLRMLERRGWLAFHGVGEPVIRGWMIDDHWTARVIEHGSRGSEWAIDTWFREPGFPAAVFPLEAWRSGAKPPLERRPRAAL